MKTIFYNGKIYTMDEGIPMVEAMAVWGGIIQDVGSSEAVMELCGPDAVRIDLGGRAVIPGLVDAHAHFMGYAKQRERLELRDCSSVEDLLRMVAERAAAAGEGEWIIGRGWDQNKWKTRDYPTRSDLDEIAPGNPVYLVRVCGHAALTNSKALGIAGISAETPDPDGGKIFRDIDGEPTGVLLDEAKLLVSEVVPPLSKDKKKKLLVEAAGDCLSVGLVGVHDMGISGEDASIYGELYSEGVMPFRITAYYSHAAEDLDSLLDCGPSRELFGELFSVPGVKFYADGSLGARSAALLEDYTDDPGNRGLLVTDSGELYEKISICHRKGFQAAVHAIGDRANRLVLDIFEKVLSEYPEDDRRHRVEHAQVISPSDIPRFAAIGLIPSMQFTHCVSDMAWAGGRLGPGRLEGAYAWRSLLSAGCIIPGGSDFPVERINPFLGIRAAVTRTEPGESGTSGWMPEQCLTVQEAVKAFTVDAAYAAHQEDLRGSLAPGKLADFIVLSQDLMAAEKDSIGGTRVLATVLGGEIVYSSELFTSAPGR